MADASINFDALSYNSMRDDLVIPEYGRSIHQMIAHCLRIAEREERSKCAAAIVSVMGSVVPQEGEKEGAENLMWTRPIPSQSPLKRTALLPKWTTPMRNRAWVITARRPWI